MDASKQSEIINGHIIPKDTSANASATSPPPAYTPRTTVELRHSAIRGPSSPRTIQHIQIHDPRLGRPVQTTFLSGRMDEAVASLATPFEEEEEDSSSSISLRISTAVTVTKDNNLVCLADAPATQAGAIANAIVVALHHGSAGQCGIPMIDEDGRPRPIHLEVDSGLLVEGSGNVIGSEAIVNEVLRQRAATAAAATTAPRTSSFAQPRPRRQREEEDDDLYGAAAKRSRSQ